MPRIKVMHVLTDTNIGGAGTLLYNTMCCASADRFEYVVVLPRGSRLIERFWPLACRVVTVNCAQDRSLELGALGEYVRLIRRERPDILHTHAAFTARLAGKLCRVPVCIQTRHCVFPMTAWQKTTPSRVAFRLGSRFLSDRVIAVADAARDNLVALGMDKSQIEVIINGVLPVRECDDGEVDALRESLGLTDRHFVVGMPARLEHYKGQATVLEAAALCKNAAPDMRFLFLGDGSQIDRYQELAQALDIEDRVRFCGFVDDLAPYYGIMDLNVNASFGTETSSLSLSEGMSVGVPALASHYGGNPRMIEPGVNGFMFPPHDAKALAALLLRLYDDRALCHALSNGARRLYRERFTAEAMVRQLEGLYTRLTVEHARRVAFST
jgi:glycosyltransferase involved in cell wall biosynthesis